MNQVPLYHDPLDKTIATVNQLCHGKWPQIIPHICADLDAALRAGQWPGKPICAAHSDTPAQVDYNMGSVRCPSCGHLHVLGHLLPDYLGVRPAEVESLARDILGVSAPEPGPLPPAPLMDYPVSYEQPHPAQQPQSVSQGPVQTSPGQYSPDRTVPPPQTSPVPQPSPQQQALTAPLTPPLVNATHQPQANTAAPPPLAMQQPAEQAQGNPQSRPPQPQRPAATSQPTQYPHFQPGPNDPHFPDLVQFQAPPMTGPSATDQSYQNSQVPAQTIPSHPPTVSQVSQQPAPVAPPPTAAAQPGMILVPDLPAEGGEPFDGSFELCDDAYHGLAGEIVRAFEPYSEADPVTVLLHLLVYTGCYIGSGPHFDVCGVRHPPRLFGVAVGETGTARKGTADAYPRRLFEKIDPAFVANNCATGLSSGQGVIHSVRNGAGDDPGVADKRRLFVEDEFAGPLAHMSKPGAILSQIIRSAWDSGNLAQATRHNPYRATGSHICIIGHITREELTSRLSTSEIFTGFANRFLWCVSQRSKLLPNPQPVADTTLDHYAARLSHAIQFARSGVGRVTRDPQADQLWAEMYSRFAEPRKGLLAAVTARSAPYTLRLSLLYALLDCSAVVTETHLRAGFALWDYCERSAHAIFADPRQINSDCSKLYNTLAGSPEGITRADVSRLFSGNKTREELDEIVSDLAGVGLIRAEEVGEGRNKTIVYFAQPGKI